MSLAPKKYDTSNGPGITSKVSGIKSEVSMSKVMRPIRLAIDNGYYDHKVAWYEGGEIKTLKYPAIVGSAIGGGGMSNSTTGGSDCIFQTEDGARFVVHDAIQNKIPIRNSEYGYSVANRVLVNHGMKAVGISDGREVNLVTSLPVQDFFTSEGEINRDLVERQKKNMMEPVYSVGAQGKLTRIAKVSHSAVVSEAVAAAFDYLIPSIGAPKADLEAPIAVLDFGGSTFDIVTLTRDLQIRHSSSATLRRGTIDIVEPLREIIKQQLLELGVKVDKVPDWRLNKVMLNRVYRFINSELKGNLGDRELPMDKAINQAASGVVEEIRHFIREKLKNFSEYEAIILVGGGALLCKDLFKDWSDAYNFVVSDEFANARGLLKIASSS